MCARPRTGSRCRNALDLAEAGCLQPVQAVSRRLFCILIALPLVLGFQASPFIRVYRLDIGALELAVRRRLRSKQCRIRPVNAQLDVLPRLRMSTGTRSQAGNHTSRFCTDFLPTRIDLIDFTTGRIARASGQPDRQHNHGNGQQSRAQRQRPIQPQPRSKPFTAPICTVCRIRHRHSNHFDSRRGRLRPPLATISRA